MATSYSHKSWGHTVGYWWYEVTESNINTNNNTSKITVKFYVKAAHGNQRSDTYNNYPAGYGSSTPYSRIYINGTLVTTKNPACFDLRYNSSKKIANGTVYNLGSASATIKHNSNGGGSVTVKCQHYTSVSPNWVTLESSHGLTTIAPPVNSGKISATNANVGGNTKVTLKNGTGDFYAVQIHGGGTLYLNNLKLGTHNIKIPSEWASYIQLGSTVQAAATCYTYKGGVHKGTDSCIFYITNADGGATLSLPSGTHNIGSKFQFTLKNCKSYLRYSIWCYSGKNSGWIQHSNQAQYSDGNHTIIFNEIPTAFKNGVANQGTDTMYVVVYTYHNGVHVASDVKSTTIKNNSYELYLKSLWIDDNRTYIENGKYTAGKTKLFVYYDVVSTFDIKRVDFKMSGANSNNGGWNWPGRINTWDSGIVWGIGYTTIQCTITDTAGHTCTKTISCTVYEEEHRLNITSFEQTNGNIYILKNHTIGNSRFKLVVKWDNTHTITNVSFKVTGANSMSHSKNNPGGKSYTWLTDNVYNVGNNKITVTLKDSKGQTRTSTINVKTSEEAYTMNVDNSIVDSKLCVDLVKGLAYMDYSRLGVRIKVNHTHALKTVKVTINGKENTLKNIDQYAKEFTFIDPNKVNKAGDVIIKFYAQDVNGREDSHSITYKTYKIIEPPKKPTISYEDAKNMIYLSEGEKIVFEGESTKIEDYQVIYALSSCDVINALTFCDNLTNSYLEANKGTLTTNLNNNATGTLRYFILKDFGVNSNNSIVTADSNNTKKFHIHPLTPGHEKFYALQFLNEAKPGDKIYVYVRERKMGTFDSYLYSDNYAYNKVPKDNLFSMCVLPPSPCQLNIYKKEQTSDKIIIKYSNPLYNANVGSDTINLIDVCLIAKDQAGNLLDTNGSKSKSENRKRDGMNGKTWVYYTERKWHNIVPKVISSNNRKEFEMSFDISNYPKGTCFNIVAFYYPDYYNHPSIYSTSNIININKSNIGMNLQISEPANGTTSTTANPTFKIRVNSLTTEKGNFSSIYENYNAATNWTKTLWDKNPIWFRVPRTKDSQVPNFTRGVCYVDNQPSKAKLSEPKYKVEIYNKNKDIYRTASLFRIPDASINDEGSFKENALFIRANDNNQVFIGDIETSTLLEQGYIDFTWQQQSGRFLSIGENKIEAFTTPYLYDNEMIDYLEHQSYWVSDTTLYSMPIMPYNPFRNSILKPTTKSWADVEGDILTIKVPYALLKPSKEYIFKFSHFADDGFFFEEPGTITSSDLEDLCEACLFTNVDAVDLIGINYNQKNIIYSPSYCLITDSANIIQEVNNYNKWIQNQIRFTTPNESKMIELDKENKNIIIKLKVRGINILKIKDITLASSDGSHEVDTDKGTLDVAIRENRKSITVFFQGSIDIKFGYINPLSYKDMMDLRDYLKALSSVYGVSPTLKLRTLVKDQSYLMASDYNDMKKYCIELFTLIQKKYPYTFNANIEEFNKLPTIVPGESRGLSTYSNRGKHYFPEWDDLIDAIAGAFFKQTNLIPSTECVTWSSNTDNWIRHNQTTFLKTGDNTNAAKLISSMNSVGYIFEQQTANVTHRRKQSNFQLYYYNKAKDNTQQSNYSYSEIQYAAYFFFDQTLWKSLIDSNNQAIQIIFKADKNSGLNINDFSILGHSYTDSNQLVNNILSEDIEFGPTIGGCTNYSSSGEITFICKASELKKWKGIKLILTKPFIYFNLMNTCTIKYY